MSKHTHKPNLEWGSKARKREDAQRGMNAADRRMAIEEQVEDAVEPDPDWTRYRCDLP
jgi:hypothetical protein